MKKSLIIHLDELSFKWIDKMASLHVDTLAIHPRGGWRACQSLTNLVEQAKTPQYRELINYAISCGLQIEYEIHTANYILPRELFHSNPEYFRMNAEGERVTDYNFCPSEPAALELAAKRAAELADALYGSNHHYYFWMEDHRDSHCHCPKCRELSPSDQQLMVMNAYVKELRKTKPDATVAYLAYLDLLKTPTHVMPEEGIILEYADIDRDQKTPIRKLTALHAEMERLLDFFGKKDSRILEYWYDNSLFSKWTKPPVQFTPQNEIIRDDLRFYAELGFENAASFACYLGSEYEDLYGEPDLSAYGE